jgi:hypothetical protein
MGKGLDSNAWRLAAFKLGRLPHKFVQQNLNSINQFASIFANHVCGAAIARHFRPRLWCSKSVE